MFVTCKKKVKFTHPDNPSVVWEMKPGFIGDIPKWVEKHWYFEALCKDGSIAAIVSKKDKDIQDAIESKGGATNVAKVETAAPSNDEQPKKTKRTTRGNGAIASTPEDDETPKNEDDETPKEDYTPKDYGEEKVEGAES